MSDRCDRPNLSAPAMFEAVLYPNQSLGGTGFAVLMAAIVLVSGLVGAGFALVGAWPVSGFLGLDVVLLYLAFRWNARQSRRADVVRLDQNGLLVRRILPGGKEQSWRFQTAWVQVELEGREVRLRSHGKELVIGTFLTSDERQAFAASLKSALDAHRAKGPGGAPAPADDASR